MNKNVKYMDLISFENLDPEKIDHAQMSRILEALDVIRDEARKLGNEDIESLINSTFNIILICYATALRASGKEKIIPKPKTEELN